MTIFRKRITNLDKRLLSYLKTKVSEERIYYKSYVISPEEFFIRDGYTQQGNIRFIIQDELPAADLFVISSSFQEVTISIINVTINSNGVLIQFNIKFNGNIQVPEFFDIEVIYDKKGIYMFESSVQ